MLSKALLTALVISLFCSNALAFDTVGFNMLDKNSASLAKRFLTLPKTEAKNLALKHVQLKAKNQTNYAWQLFLISFLSTQELSPEQWTLLKDKSLLFDIGVDKKRDQKIIRTITKKLDQQDDEKSELCFILLDRIFFPLKKDLNKEQKQQRANQEEVFNNIEKACITQLIKIINREDVFNWYLKTLEKDKYNSELLALFKQHELTDRIIFQKRQGVNFEILNKEQRAMLANAWLPYFVGKKVNSELRPYSLSRVIKFNDGDEFKNDFVTALKAELTINKPQENLIDVLKGLVSLESKSSSALFLELAWKTPKYKNDISVFKEALEEVYGDNNRNESFPDSLHTSARELIANDKDIRFADFYLYLMTNVEGGNWDDEHVKIIKIISKVTPNLDDDKETQGVLKHALLLLANLEYQHEKKNLMKVKAWLDKAQAIQVPAIFWYGHLTNTKDDSYEHYDDFKSIKKLHEEGQLSDFANWIDNKTKPKKPFSDLSLELYDLFIDGKTHSRIWHNQKNGHALILSDDGSMHYFNGYEVDSPDENGLSITHMISGENSLNNTVNYKAKPKVTSSIDRWIGYAIDSFLNKDKNKVEISVGEIKRFPINNQASKKRLLFARLEGKKLSRYPDYLEYSQYGNQIMVSIDLDDEIAQYSLTFTDENVANQWMNDIEETTPIEYKKDNLWYKSTGSSENQEHGIMIREYVTDDKDYRDKVISVLDAKGNFDSIKNGCTPFNSNELEQYQAAFNQQELDIYKKGYVLKRIYHDEECLEKSE